MEMKISVEYHGKTDYTGARLNSFYFTLNTHVLIGWDKLGPGVAGHHPHDDHLSPLLHIHQQVAQLAVILVDEVDSLGTDLLKGLNGTPCY